MLARSLCRVSTSSVRHVRVLPRTYVSSFVGGHSWSPSPLIPPTVVGVLPLQQRQLQERASSSRRYLSSKKRRSSLRAEEEEDVDVTPVGNKPGQIPREVIEEAEAAEDLGDDEILAGSPSDWDFDDSTEDGEKAEARRAEELGDEDENPPTPILDAYERSRDPVEMERLIKMSFDSLPERAGPQRYNHKRREQQRWKTIRKIKGKEKKQRQAAHERKLQKRRDRKARDLALFATWRGTGTEADATVKS
ncbi:unnamed protein product [Pylaiella littoralis]